MFLSLLASTALALQPAPAEPPFDVEVVVDFEEPWAMDFLPDGRMLVTEKEGKVLIASADGTIEREVTGLPEVEYGGQGGLGDITVHPDFAENGLVYISYAELGKRNRNGAAVGRGILNLATGELSDYEVIWQQMPKVSGRGHYGHRMVFSPDGEHLFISSGERQKFNPSQNMNMNLGKILRLYPDGSIPEDNPFFGDGGVTAEIWTVGMRNPLGMDFDAEGTLWEVEMGPAGGDEFQRIEEGANYGYPTVSNGDHYSGREIPDHSEGDGFRAPDFWWTPVISPSSMVIYQGAAFPAWQGSSLISGLSSKALVRVSMEDCPGGADACEVERFDMGARIRSVVEGPEGNVWLLEDGGKRGEGRLLKLTPKG